MYFPECFAMNAGISAMYFLKPPKSFTDKSSTKYAFIRYLANLDQTNSRSGWQIVRIRGDAQAVSDGLPFCRVDPRSKYVVREPNCTRRRCLTPCGQTDNRLSGQHNAQARHGCAGSCPAHDGQNSRSGGAATQRPGISPVTRPILPDCQYRRPPGRRPQSLERG